MKGQMVGLEVDSIVKREGRCASVSKETWVPTEAVFASSRARYAPARRSLVTDLQRGMLTFLLNAVLCGLGQPGIDSLGCVFERAGVAGPDCGGCLCGGRLCDRKSRSWADSGFSSWRTRGIAELREPNHPLYRAFAGESAKAPAAWVHGRGTGGRDLRLGRRPPAATSSGSAGPTASRFGPIDAPAISRLRGGAVLGQP
jgi:hypothetical protein